MNCRWCGQNAVYLSDDDQCPFCRAWSCGCGPRFECPNHSYDRSDEYLLDVPGRPE